MHISSIFYDHFFVPYWGPAYWLTYCGTWFENRFFKTICKFLVWSTAQLPKTASGRMGRPSDIAGRRSPNCITTWLTNGATGILLSSHLCIRRAPRSIARPVRYLSVWYYGEIRLIQPLFTAHQSYQQTLTARLRLLISDLITVLHSSNAGENRKEANRRSAQVQNSSWSSRSHHSQFQTWSVGAMLTVHC